MTERFSRGSTIKLYLDIVTAGAAATGQLPTLALRRESDGKWLQFSDLTWQATLVNNAMTEVDAANRPGRYVFSFDQTLDAVVGSTTYTAILVNTGASARREYRDLVFEPLTATVAAGLCAIQGSLFTMSGDALPGAEVTATLLPVLSDALGRGYENEHIVRVWSREDGSFSLPVVRGASILLKIARIGYARKVTVPNAASVLYTAL